MKKLLLILLCLPFMGFGQNVYIPDANFKAYLVANSAINTNGDSEIQVSEATAFNGLIFVNSLSITDLTGIESFINLTQLRCEDNQLTSIDLSNNTALTYLNCNNNQITSINLSNNTALGGLRIDNNQLTSLDVSNNTTLTSLLCDSNQLTSLDVSNNTALVDLSFSNNQLTALDVSNNTALTYLYCYNNSISILDVSNNTPLQQLHCRNNQLICLDISQNNSLNYLNCSQNILEQLNTRNGNWVNGITIYAETNNLTCVEVDNLGYANSSWINSFDSFVTFSTNCNYTNPCNTSTAIQDFSIDKELLKVTDLLGRETKQTNQPLLYIYDDGTVEKRIVID